MFEMDSGSWTLGNWSDIWMTIMTTLKTKSEQDFRWQILIKFLDFSCLLLIRARISSISIHHLSEWMPRIWNIRRFWYFAISSQSRLKKNKKITRSLEATAVDYFGCRLGHKCNCLLDLDIDQTLLNLLSFTAFLETPTLKVTYSYHTTTRLQTGSQHVTRFGLKIGDKL